MSDGKFGGSGMSGSAGDPGFDFFGGNEAPQGSGGSPFGSAPSAFGAATPVASPGAAPNGSSSPSFGSPAFGAPPAPSFGAPPGQTGYGLSGSTAAMSVKAGHSRRRTAGLVVLVLGVLFGAFWLWRFYEHHRAITVPTTLGGLTQNTDVAVTDALATSKASIQQANPGFTLDGAMYGTLTNGSMLFVARGDSDVTKELNDFGGTQEQVGTSICSTAASHRSIACIRTGGQLTVLVISLSSDPDRARVAGLVDEAWRQQ